MQDPGKRQGAIREDATGRHAARPAAALFQPDIPQNTGTILRLCACFGVAAHLIEPAGFPFSDAGLKRAGLDYIERAALTRHVDFRAFERWRRARTRRLVLLTTRAEIVYTDFAFSARDILMVGSESAGVPASVHVAADTRLCIPIRSDTRSLNVAVSLAMALGEALRQTRSFPPSCRVETAKHSTQQIQDLSQ